MDRMGFVRTLFPRPDLAPNVGMEYFYYWRDLFLPKILDFHVLSESFDVRISSKEERVSPLLAFAEHIILDDMGRKK